MSRVSAAEIVLFVAELVNDRNHENHSQDDIQDALDAGRWEARNLQLVPLPTRSPSGVTYVAFQAPKGWRYWETDALLYDGGYNSLSPSTSDWTTGRWVLATEPSRPVSIVGFSHDPYGAAADLLLKQAASHAEDVQSFNSVNGSFVYPVATKRRALEQMAATYQAKSRKQAGVGKMMRGDVRVWRA